MQLIFLSIVLIIPFLILVQCSNPPDGTALSPDVVEISYNVKGKGKPALVLIHGWTNNKTIWNDQVSHFSEKYKVVTIDLAGHGESGNNRRDWTISAFGEDVVAVINKLKLKDVILVGFSMGGPVVVEASTYIPQKVRGIIFVDTLKDIEQKRQLETAEKQYEGLLQVLSNPSPEMFRGSYFKRNLDVQFERVLTMYENDFSTIGWKESLAGTLYWYNEECTETLKEINAPVVAINSDNSPTNIEAISKYIPSFRVNIINNTGHVVMWDAPDEFNQLLDGAIKDFLK